MSVAKRRREEERELLLPSKPGHEAGEIMHRPTLGEIVERALLALEREMKGKGA